MYQSDPFYLKRESERAIYLTSISDFGGVQKNSNFQKSYVNRGQRIIRRERGREPVHVELYQEIKLITK